MKVIIASTSATLTNRVQARVMACGFMVEAVIGNSYELLRQAKSLSPRLIIIDDELEGGNLASVIETLTRDRRPVIVLGMAYKKDFYQPSPYLEFSHKPVQLPLLENTIRMLVKYSDSLRVLETKVEHYEQKQKTDKAVSHAKKILQEHESMTEEAAHRYIQKKEHGTTDQQTGMRRENNSKFQ
ncbi:MAG: antitermination regulator [Turicibacter sp.]|nr:antitermination regulator [Turicibacter sp.]